MKILDKLRMSFVVLVSVFFSLLLKLSLLLSDSGSTIYAEIKLPDGQKKIVPSLKYVVGDLCSVVVLTTIKFESIRWVNIQVKENNK